MMILFVFEDTKKSKSTASKPRFACDRTDQHVGVGRQRVPLAAHAAGQRVAARAALPVPAGAWRGPQDLRRLRRRAVPFLGQAYAACSCAPGKYT